MRGVDENNLSHHLLEEAAVPQQPAEKSEGTGRGRVQKSQPQSHKTQGGCHLNAGLVPSAKNSQGPSQVYPPLTHKNPCESPSTWECDPETPGISCQQEQAGSSGEKGWLWLSQNMTRLPYFLTTSLNLGSPPVDTQAQPYNTILTVQGKPLENQ